MKKNFRKIEALDVIVWIFAILMMVIVVLPFLNVVSLSLSSSSAILQGKVSFWPVGITFDAYAEMLRTPKILNAYKNSFIYTFGGVALSLVLLTLTAYPLSRKGLPGRGKIIGMILFTMFFNGGMIPFYILMQNLGLMDSVWAIILPWAIPQFQLLLLKNYFENVPDEIYEAAIMDGASEFRILGQIFVPLAAPIFATVAIMIATSLWNNYMNPLMYLTTQSKFPLQLVLQEMLVEDKVQDSPYTQGATLTPTGLKNVTVMISVLPLLIIYPFVQRFFIGSIYVGAVKG